MPDPANDLRAGLDGLFRAITALHALAPIQNQSVVALARAAGAMYVGAVRMGFMPMEEALWLVDPAVTEIQRAADSGNVELPESFRTLSSLVDMNRRGELFLPPYADACTALLAELERDARP